MGRDCIQHRDIYLRVRMQTAAVQVGRACGPPLVIDDSHFGMYIHWTVGEMASRIVFMSTQCEDGQAARSNRCRTLLPEPGNTAIGETTSAVGVIGQDNRQRDSS